MASKKGIELSLNFIIVILLSLIIFGFGVRFISKLSSEATSIQDMTLNELDIRIGELICEGFDKVCISIERKTIRRTKFDFFGVKILNVIEPQNFDVIVSRPSPSGYKKNKEEIPSDDLSWIPRSRSIFIDKNEEKTVGIGVQVPSNAVSGTYIFNVEIKTSDGDQYSMVHKLYVDVP